MKPINYEKIIPNHVGPKLAFYGFKYDEDQSYPPQGHYSFTRNYWGTSQRVSICPVEYDFETVGIGRTRNNDSPSEVPRSLLLIQEPGFRLWLSNRFVTAVLESEHRSVDLVPHQGIAFNTETPADTDEFKTKLTTGPSFQAGEVLPTWWEFAGEDELRQVLDQIVQMIVTDGLRWFEERVADVRRYHEKLDRRRLASTED